MTNDTVAPNVCVSFEGLINGLSDVFVASIKARKPKTINLGAITSSLIDVAKEYAKQKVFFDNVQEVFDSVPYVAQLDALFNEVGFSEEMAQFYLQEQDFWLNPKKYDNTDLSPWMAVEYRED